VQQVQRLGCAPDLGDRAAQRRGASAALQDAQQLARADRAGRERSEDAQDVVPVREDQPGVDAVACEAVQRAVAVVAVEIPEALVGQPRGARAELVAEQPVQAEDLVGVGGLVGDDHRRAAGAGRLELEQAVERD